jgi:acetyl-CoA carboxylase carboxyl transferase subunit beta
MLELRTPTVAVLLGQGTGGGALALLPADRVIAAPHAWLAPLAPEGASAIVYRDTAHAPEMARSQGITANDLASLGMVDQIVPDYSGLAVALADSLASLSRLDDDSRLTARAERFRSL